MPTTLVTGGAGFIGSHLCDALLSVGHQVRVLDDLSTGRRENLDPRCTLVVGDVADAAAVLAAAKGVDAIFHLAAVASVARSNEDWVGTHRVNQTGTVAVLDAARALGRIPVAYASSAAVYGDQGSGAIREDALPSPRTAYGADKLGSELHARVGFGVHGLPSCGFRFFNVYGARQDPTSPYSGVISIFAERIARQLPITVHGAGRQTRDFVYVADVVAHLLAGLRYVVAEPQAAVFNVCTGRATDLLSLAAMIGAAVGWTPEIHHGPTRPGDIRDSLGCPRSAIERLRVRAETTLAAGLRRTLATKPTGSGAVPEPQNIGRAASTITT